MGLFNLFKHKKLHISTNLANNNDQKLIFKENTDALTQVFNTQSFYGEEKHIFNNKIIQKYSNSNNSNDILAVAISYLGEGAECRNSAINYFEKYLSCPSSQKYFSDWFIYSSLSTLYEKEYMFNKSIECLKVLIKLDNSSNCADYIRIGNVLTKIDINKAIEYYEDLKNKNIYAKYKYAFDNAYKEILLKKEKGYVYKPRKKK